MRHKGIPIGRKQWFYYGMTALVIAALIVSCIRRDLEHIFLCLLSLALFTVPNILKERFQLYIPAVIEVCAILFIVCGIVLGEVESFFVRFKYWDTILHTFNGIACAALSLSLVVLLNRQEKILFRLSPIFLMIVAVSFAMLIGVLWEFFEFGMDCFFGMDTQKDTWIYKFSTVSLDPLQTGNLTTISPIESVSINNGEIILDGYLDIGLYDTMEDLFVTFIGAVAFNLFAAMYAKKHNGFIWSLIIGAKETVKHDTEEMTNEV